MAIRRGWRWVAVALATVAFLGAAYVAVREPLRRLTAEATPTPTATGIPSPTPTPAAAPGGASAAPPDGAPSGVPMPTEDMAGWRRVFEEDFPGTRLDSRWDSYDGQPDGDPGGWFDPSHVSVAGGLLTIGGWREPARQNLYVTGGISNRRVLSQVYGRYDVRFRMDPGRGIAYALLLWPASNDYPPEIDFAEDNGRDRRTLYSAVHPTDGSKPIERRLAGDFTQWHTVGVQWRPGLLTYTMDGQPWASVSGSAVPSEPMTLALQTQAWYCAHTWEACPDATTPARVNLEVDWVVAYAPTR